MQDWIAQEWLALGALGAVAVLAVALAVALCGLRRRTSLEVAAARADAAELRAAVEDLRSQMSRPPVSHDESGGPQFVITGLGEVEPATPPHIDRALFADLVLRESVVKTASLAHGLRRALSPEVRNRIRFEIRREVKRARKQRRTDVREAVREWEARRRAQRTDGEDAA
ncbi:MAG: hypothetical protein ACRDOM_03480 [Nocardioides sp.]